MYPQWCLSTGRGWGPLITLGREMQPALKSLSENQPEVNSSLCEGSNLHSVNSPGVPSLVINIPSSNALGEASSSILGVGAKQPSPLTPSSSWFTTWNRQQKHIFQTLMSWMGEALGRSCQLFRVDLTTGPGGDSKLLGRHFQELRRRIERRQGYRIEYFKVETSEGNGVLHMVWAIELGRPAYVDQAWLSSEWVKIHGAHRVWIDRMGRSGNSVQRVARYIVSQYLAGQKASALVRASWSWWRSRVSIGRAWRFMKREMRDVTTSGISWTGFDRSLPRSAIIETWNEVLRKGSCVIAGVKFFLQGRSLHMLSGGKVTSDRDKSIFKRPVLPKTTLPLRAHLMPIVNREESERQGRWLQAWRRDRVGRYNEVLGAMYPLFAK